MSEDTGIIEGLVDISFSKFVSSTVIKYLYVLAQILNVVGAVVFVGLGLKSGLGFLITFFCAALLLGFFCILTRIWAELLIVIFRIAENTRRIAENSKDVAM